jgi:hypothetical protein
MDFSLYFTQLSVGCIGLLPVVPWRAVGKGYYVMMLAVGLGLLAVAGLFRADGLYPGLGPGMYAGRMAFVMYAGLGILGLAALAAFLMGHGRLGAVATAAAAVCGALAVAADGSRAASISRDLAHPLPHGSGAIVPLVAFNFLSGTLLLGSVLSAMLLGHWYLVVKDLPVKPLRTMTQILFAALGARLAATVAAFLIDPEGGRAVAHRSFIFVLVYGLFSLGSPIGMSWMIWGTVRIRSTQAATGILYGVTAFILMGEAAGRFVLIKTGFPL